MTVKKKSQTQQSHKRFTFQGQRVSNEDIFKIFGPLNECLTESQPTARVGGPL